MVMTHSIVLLIQLVPQFIDQMALLFEPISIQEHYIKEQDRRIAYV